MYAPPVEADGNEVGGEVGGAIANGIAASISIVSIDIVRIIHSRRGGRHFCHVAHNTVDGGVMSGRRVIEMSGVGLVFQGRRNGYSVRREIVETVGEGVIALDPLV